MSDSTTTTPLSEAAPGEQQPQSYTGEADLNFSSLNDYIKQTYGGPNGLLALNTSSESHHHPQSASVDEEQQAAFCIPSPFSISGDASEAEESWSLKSNTQHSLIQDSDDPTTPRGAPNGGKWTLRRIALDLSLYMNLFITFAKLIAYIDTFSLSVLAALLDSVLDVVSQVVLNYTEKHSSMQRSSAFYPAGASRLEPIGVLTCAALMGMASFEVLKESGETLFYKTGTLENTTLKDEILSFWSMVAILIIKLFLYYLCKRANHKSATVTSKRALQLADPTLEALAQDHWNDTLSNGVAATALIFALYSKSLWFLDPIGAILISLYIIWSWYETGKEQIEQLTGKSAPKEFIDELYELADHFDQRMQVDTIRAYHFGPKFLVELEVVMPENTPLKTSHDAGMELQYEIEAQEDVERCFVHIDYETRDYDEHVVSKVPELREQLLRRRAYKCHVTM
mmetsp:Transcript_12292/g.29269  ORF Transcript_12292/g.29269 Transcript_12292/m.29269 type:complete len:455 (+) Transcript_12292:189-1553(+)|eukprot:CAMPEP_0113632544 /NCGR_PEP_ID=MMETSP0017_2-20120614/16918_1 /TAXON_ID=2856 /ORGANISM="Cylindrotheca closterium" /LENGTH=454 /DNA_ID=CAMNT_0000543109 /DNA_START=122 /DNA_END=1486 /DNA_ORIENTATION=- /assembly_acc=CAM_ASM_000147